MRLRSGVNNRPRGLSDESSNPASSVLDATHLAVLTLVPQHGVAHLPVDHERDQPGVGRDQLQFSSVVLRKWFSSQSRFHSWPIPVKVQMTL
jgi:hypothetical protein